MKRPILTRGDGNPVTVFAHGFGSGIADTRPYASGVAGTRVFYTARAHDGVPVEEFSYSVLADDLRELSDDVGATQAFGVSMGAGTLTRLLERTPDRFERVVFMLPAVLDVPRSDVARAVLGSLGDAIASGDHARLTAAIAAGIPESVRDTPSAVGYAKMRADTLLMPSLSGVLETLAEQTALDDRAHLARVTVPALVIAATGDPAHPDAVAREMADILPSAQLEILGGPDAVWTRRDRLRALVSEFLSDGRTSLRLASCVNSSSARATWVGASRFGADARK